MLRSKVSRASKVPKVAEEKFPHGRVLPSPDPTHAGVAAERIKSRTALLVALIAALSTSLGLLVQGWLAIMPLQREIARLEAELNRERLQTQRRDFEIEKLKADMSRTSRDMEGRDRALQAAQSAIADRDRPKSQLRERGFKYEPHELYRAIQVDDVTALQLFLQAGMSPRTTVGPSSLLAIAVEHGSLNSMRVLLASEASASSEPPTLSESKTLLNYALSKTREDAALLLFANGAKPDCQTLNGSFTMATSERLAKQPRLRPIPAGFESAVGVERTIHLSGAAEAGRPAIAAGVSRLYPEPNQEVLREAYSRAKDVSVRVQPGCR